MRDGAYYEFGIYKGYSLYWAERVTRSFRGQDFMFYGFDSFEGMPPSEVDQNKDWFPGAYKASLEEVEKNLVENGAVMDRIVLTKGFFSKDLFSRFDSWKPPAVVLVDSDIYESCVEVLDFIGPRCVPGTVIVFDDFHSSVNGETRALREFEQKNPSFRLRRLFRYEADGEVFEVVAASGEH